MGNWNFFESKSGGSASGGDVSDFVENRFQDISIPASSNGPSFTVNANTNPTGGFFYDDDAPHVACKTLFIKDVIPILDPSKWVNGEPTSLIQFTEQFPGIVGYVSGNNINVYTELDYVVASIDSTQSGTSYKSLYNARSSFGAIGNFRNCVPLFGLPNMAAGASFRGISFNVVYLLDGVTTQNFLPQVVTSSDASSVVSSDAMNPNINAGRLPKFYGKPLSSTNLTDDLHHFQMRAVPNGTSLIPNALKLYGFMFYFEGTSGQAFGKYDAGKSYVNKTAVSASLPAGFSMQTGFGAGRDLYLCKSIINGYTTVLAGVTGAITTGTGSSGGNLISVAAGTGQSFIIGQGIVAQSGASAYLGYISSISTDILTVGPTLNTGVSGGIYTWFQGGASMSVDTSIHSVKFMNDFSDWPTSGNRYYNRDQEIAIVLSDNIAFTQETADDSGNFFLTQTPIRGRNFVSPSSTPGVLYCEGRFTALDVIFTSEFAASTGATIISLNINGFTTVSSAIGMSFIGQFKKTIFTDGSNGWNRVSMNFTSSSANGIAGLVFYEYKAPGATGLLAKTQTLNQFQLAQAQGINGFTTNGNAIGFFNSPGTYRRYYGNEIFFSGTGWKKTVGDGLMEYYATNTQGDILDFTFFGKAFALVGQSLQAYTGCTLLIDGVASGVTFGQWITVGTTDGFHEINLMNRASNGQTIAIYSVDVARTYGEVSNKQTLIVPFQNQNGTALRSKGVTTTVTLVGNRVQPFYSDSIGVTTAVLTAKKITDSYRVKGFIIAQANSTSAMIITLPSGLLIDYSKLGIPTATFGSNALDYNPIVGQFFYNGTSLSDAKFTDKMGVLFLDPAIGIPNAIYFGITMLVGANNKFQFLKMNMNQINGGGLALTFFVDFEVPVVDTTLPNS